jgi:hypothetical protein
MDSIVLELQHDALNEKTSVTSLLRKAMVIAKKLKIAELERWVEQELNGYPSDAKIPDYRHTSGEVKSFNPYNGLWLPVMWRGSEPAGFSRRASIQSIPELEDLISKENKDGLLMMPFSAEATAVLMRAFPDMVRPPVLVISKSSVVGIVAKVRNLILDWTLKLEEQGIVGKSMTFTRSEIQNASSKRDIIIENFQGVIGDVSNSTLHQNLRMEVRQGDFASLAGMLGKNGVNEADIHDLKRAIMQDPKPNSSSELGTEVSAWMGKMIGKAASGVWQLSVAVAGKLLAEAIARYYGFTS